MPYNQEKSSNILQFVQFYIINLLFYIVLNDKIFFLFYLTKTNSFE